MFPLCSTTRGTFSALLGFIVSSSRVGTKHQLKSLWKTLSLVDIWILIWNVIWFFEWPGYFKLIFWAKECHTLSKPVPFSLLMGLSIKPSVQKPICVTEHALGSSADSSTVTFDKVKPQYWNVVSTMQPFRFNNRSQSIKKGHSIVETCILYWSIAYLL